MNLVWSILLMLRPWTGYDYSVIQVLGRASRIKETLPNFCENMDSDK